MRGSRMAKIGFLHTFSESVAKTGFLHTSFELRFPIRNLFNASTSGFVRSLIRYIYKTACREPILTSSFPKGMQGTFFVHTTG